MSLKNPTIWQLLTLEKLCWGWELIDDGNLIYWKYYHNGSIFPHTIECGYAKVKRYQMSFLEQYGWIIKKEDKWYITDAGRDVYSNSILAK